MIFILFCLIIKFFVVNSQVIQANVSIVCSNPLKYNILFYIHICRWKLGEYDYPDNYEAAINDCPNNSKLLNINPSSLPDFSCNYNLSLWKSQSEKDNVMLLSPSGITSFVNATSNETISHFACVSTLQLQLVSFDCMFKNVAYTRNKLIYISEPLSSTRTNPLIEVTKLTTTNVGSISKCFGMQSTTLPISTTQTRVKAIIRKKKSNSNSNSNSGPNDKKKATTKLNKISPVSIPTGSFSNSQLNNTTKANIENGIVDVITTMNNFKIQNTTSAINTTTGSTWYTGKCVIQKSRRNLYNKSIIQTVNFTVDNLKLCDRLDEQYKRNYIATYNLKRDEQLNAIKMKTEIRINKIATQYKTPIYSSYITGIVALIVILGFVLLVLLNDSIKLYFYWHDYIKPALRVKWLVPERVQVFKTFHERERCMSQVRELDKQLSNKFETILLKHFIKK